MSNIQINLIEYLPDFLKDIDEFKVIMSAETKQFYKLLNEIESNLDNNFIDFMTLETMIRIETFLGIVGEGTLEQRKSYLKALIRKGYKLSETSIKAIVKSITGGLCVVTFFAGNDSLNHSPGQGTLRVQVLSPDYSVDYKFDDILRAIAPYMPAHIKLNIIKYFATWENISIDFQTWDLLKQSKSTWQDIYNYIPLDVQNI